jgi:hypothetical protein
MPKDGAEASPSAPFNSLATDLDSEWRIAAQPVYRYVTRVFARFGYVGYIGNTAGQLVCTPVAR